MTAVVGVAPVTVFEQSQEAECICEEKCSQDSINEEYMTPICMIYGKMKSWSILQWIL